MAQLDLPRFSENNNKTPPKAQTSPTFEQLLHAGEYSVWPSSPSPSHGKYHDQEEYHTPNSKKSMFMKVKERAKKLRHTFSGKKRQEHESPDGNVTPSWGVSLDDDDEDPEYLGAPMYESELAPESYKDTIRQHPREIPVASEKRVLASSVNHEPNQEKKEHIPNSNNTITETTSKNIASKFAGLTVETHPTAENMLDSPRKMNLDRCPKTRERTGFNSPNAWDKGVSVKEYLMHKFEPGDDERALSQAITQAISPRNRNPGDMTVVEKMREAVTSFLRADESFNSANNSTISSSNVPITTTKANLSSSISQNPSSNANINSCSRIPVSTTTTNSSSRNPISTNTNEAVEEENDGRILQVN